MNDSNQPDYDVAIIGAGHNGLVCAAYLARAGLSVGVFERRSIVGGAAVTEEFAPGFRNSTASYTVSLLHPRIIGELRLARHGLRIVPRSMHNFMPLPDGSALTSGPNLAVTRRAVARHSAHDAERLSAWHAQLSQGVEFLRALSLQIPPSNLHRAADLWSIIQMGARFRRLPIGAQRNLHELFTRSAGDILDYWFECDALKALYGFDAIVGNYASPYTPGSAYVLLHHAFGHIKGQHGAWGHAIGGMGAITQAIAAEATHFGVRIEVERPIERVLVKNGVATGLVLSGGRVVRARAVAANVNPKLLYLQMLDAAELPADFRARMQRYRCGSASFRMNVALSELPRFTACPTSGATSALHHRSGIIIAPSLGYMQHAYDDARKLGWSRAPVIEMLIPSTIDDSLCPPGRHVASLFCQHFAPQLPDGRSWESARDAAVATIIDTITDYAPNFRSAVLAHGALSPWDLEQRFGLVNGDIFHGAMGLDQLWAARPVLGYGDYRSPIHNLYLCGSGAHPGGGVSGLPGYNAARRMLQDWRRILKKTKS